MTVSYATRSAVSNLVKKERGSIKKVFGSLPSVAVCFPNTYYLGASNLGVHFLYDRINAREDFLAERFFLDIQPPVSLENRKPLNRFSMILFSIPFELDFAGALRMLKQSGIPLLRKERTKHSPLIAAGGIAPTMNPLPLADFMDLLILGDGEDTLPALLDCFKQSGGEKQACLDAIGTRDGFLIPGTRSGDRIPPPARCVELDRHPLSSVFLTSETEFPDTCLIEIARGCPYRCSFCYIGHNSDPFRIRSLSSIKSLVEKNRERTNRFGLISSAVTAHPSLEDLCKWGIGEGIKISFSSLRADSLSPALLELLLESGQRTLTLAPETGSDKLRRSINKNLTNDRILDAAQKAFAAGLENLKMYFILGLPGEGTDEIRANIELVRSARNFLVEEGRKKGRVGKIIISVSFFTPKPGTPFAGEAMHSAGELRKRQRAFSAGLRSIANVKMISGNPCEALAQHRICMGGRDTGDFLLRKVKGGLSWKKVWGQFI